MRRLLLTTVTAGLLATATTAPAPAAVNGRIAYVQGGQIWTINPDGSGRRQVTHVRDLSVEDLSVSPDGRLIAFTVNNVSLVTGTSYGLYVVSSQGGRIFPITLAYDRLALQERDPSWSPDGRTLAFSGYDRTTQTRQLFTVGVDGSRLRRLTKIGAVYDVAWSPRGDRIAFTADAFDERIYTVPPSGSPATGPAEVVNGALSTALDFSPDGREIAYTADTYFVDAAHADGSPYPDAQRRRHVVWDDDPSCNYRLCWGRDPAFSPDGRLIAYGRSDANYDRQLALVPVTGVDRTRPDWGITQITSDPGTKENIDWAVRATPDRARPHVRFTAATVRGRRARIAFTAGEAPVAYSCRLDAGRARACASPATITKLRPGTHRLRVSATDPAGNRSRVAVRAFRVAR